MKKSVIHDISLPISESLAVWPGDPPISVKAVSHLANGDNATVSQLALGAHAGTHVDAPKHFILGGAGVESLDTEILVGPAVVVHVMKTGTITSKTLEDAGLPEGADRILFRTRNSRMWADEPGTFHPEYVAISEDGARWLVARGVRLVGIDYLSVAPFKNGAPTHRTLLSAGIVIVEGLDLRGIAPGPYQLVCLPLKIVGADGSPARAILIETREK